MQYSMIDSASIVHNELVYAYDAGVLVKCGFVGN